VQLAFASLGIEPQPQFLALTQVSTRWQERLLTARGAAPRSHGLQKRMEENSKARLLLRALYSRGDLRCQPSLQLLLDQTSPSTHTAGLLLTAAPVGAQLPQSAGTGCLWDPRCFSLQLVV